MSATSNLFVFGSLMDAEVLEIVLGRQLASQNRQAAYLNHYQRLCVVNECYPGLRQAPGKCVQGCLLSDLSPFDVDRVCYFEGEEFSLAECEVVLHNQKTAGALMFQLEANTQLTQVEWSLLSWQRSDKAIFMQMAKRWMQGYGVADFKTAQQLWAQHNPHQTE